MATDFLEKTLEEIVFENQVTVAYRGFPIIEGQLHRQFALPSGKIADLVSICVNNGRLFVQIFELKKDRIDIWALNQLCGYGEEFYESVRSSFKSVEIKLYLVGKTFEPLPIFSALSRPVEVYTYGYGMNGISFFKRPTSDPTFSNETFSKAVWALGCKKLAWHNPNSINIYTSYLSYIQSNPNFDSQICDLRDRYCKEENVNKNSSQTGIPNCHVPGIDLITYEGSYDDLDETIYATTE